MGHAGLKHANMPQVPYCGRVTSKRFHSDVGDLYRNESVQVYLQQLVEEYRNLSKQLQHAFLSESDRKVLIEKRAELLPVAAVFGSIEQAQKDLEEVSSLLKSE